MSLWLLTFFFPTLWTFTWLIQNASATLVMMVVLAILATGPAVKRQVILDGPFEKQAKFQ